MTDARIEVTKLAHELDCDRHEVAFLEEVPRDTVRDLRAMVAEARFVRHEARFRRVAKLAAAAPAPITARIAEGALGPLLGARVAAVLEPAVARRLAARLSPDYLADLSVHLDPARSGAIVADLPRDLVVDVGQRLLARGEHLTLGRLLSVVPTEAALAVVDEASSEELFEVALLTEDPAALDQVVAQLPDERLAQVAAVAREQGRDDDLAALLAIGNAASRKRFAALDR